MDKRLMNKRGQDLTIGTLILIVLGVVVLVLLIIGFTRGWDFIFGKFDVAPGQDLQAVQKACELSEQADLRIDYCTFKEIEFQGDTEYVNCMDDRIGVDSTMNCEGLPTGAEYCASRIDSSDFSEAKVNGKICNTFSCDELGGSLALGPQIACEDGMELVELADESMCCLSN